MGRSLRLFCVFIFASCADQDYTSLPNDTDEVSGDAGVSGGCPDYIPQLCEGECVSITQDPDNCGGCGLVCDMEYADHCENGQCRCGANPLCTNGAVCHINRVSTTQCVMPDPSGSVCDAIENLYCTDPNDECVGGHCTQLVFAAEDCDGYDNDGDGIVDEIEDTAETCYDGSPGTMYVGPCVPGLQTCTWSEFGKEYSECMFQITPISETGILACDGVDNDCDGCVDGVFIDGDECGPADPQEFDIVLMIDRSGSMVGVIAAVQIAVDSFASQFVGNDNFHFALVLFPYPTEGEVGAFDDPATPEIDGDLNEYSIFANAVAAIPATEFSQEGNYDAPYRLTTGDLPLSFRPSAQRIFVLFTDEHGQSYLDPEVSEFAMCSSFSSSDIFAAVISPFDITDFDCAFVGVNPTNLFFLSDDPTAMVDNLNSILSSPCE